MSFLKGGRAQIHILKLLGGLAPRLPLAMGLFVFGSECTMSRTNIGLNWPQEK